jgi:hypothetical protein
MDIRDSRFWHVFVLCVVGQLYNGDATATLDFPKAGGPIVEYSAQNHADHPWSINQRGGSEQRVNRRARPIFFWPYTQMYVIGFDHEMTVGRSHIGPAALNRLAILSMLYWHESLPLQDRRQEALFLGQEMQDNKNCRGEARLESAKQRLKSRKSACRGANYDYI